jgi:hypothetical protein
MGVLPKTGRSFLSVRKRSKKFISELPQSIAPASGGKHSVIYFMRRRRDWPDAPQQTASSSVINWRGADIDTRPQR